MPDEKPAKSIPRKSCIKTHPSWKKTVPDAETTYYTQGIQFIDSEHTATQPVPSVTPATEVPAMPIAIPPAKTELPKVTDEDNLSHLSDPGREREQSRGVTPDS